jgi:ABC-type oligopeptide transport system ATPase subunit
VSAGQAAPVLRVRNLSKQFTIRGSHKVVHACDDVSLEIRSGQTLGLIGESGSGKTTVGRCVLRLIDTTSGSVELDSVDIAALSDRELRELRQRMQIVFQETRSTCRCGLPGSTRPSAGAGCASCWSASASPGRPPRCVRVRCPPGCCRSAR